MQPDEIQRAREVVAEIVDRAGGEGALGAQVGVCLSKAGLNYRTGYSSLQDFFARELPEFAFTDGGPGPRKIVRRGDSPPTAPPSGPRNAWRAWTSPAYEGKITWVPSQRQLVIVEPGENTPVGGLDISRPDAAAHRDIAKLFLEQHTSRLPDEARGRLLSIIEDPASSWWSKWRTEINRLRAQQAWAVHRADHLERLFQESMSALGASGGDIGAATALLRESRDASRPPPAGPVPTTPFRSPKVQAEFIHALIDELGEEDIRTIRVPLGAVLDLMIRKGILPGRS